MVKLSIANLLPLTVISS